MNSKTDEIRLTQQQIGAAVGVTQSQASRDLRAAGIEPTASGYTLADLARLAEWRALERVGAASDGTVYDVERERGRLLAAQANLAELKLAEELGDLVRASEVGPYWAGMVVSMRTKLVGLPSRLAALIPETMPRAKFNIQAEALVFEALAEIEKGGLPPATNDVPEYSSRKRSSTSEAHTND